jgi:GT2 family glycosyltransferase
MVEQVSRPEIGCVGAKLYYPNDTVQHGGVILGLGGLAGHAHRFFQRDEDGYMGRLKVTQNLSAVTAACLLLRKDVFDAVNGLNEADLAVAYNDVDLCIKVREAGYRNLWSPYAALYHHESISRGADDTPEKRARWLSE